MGTRARWTLAGMLALLLAACGDAPREEEAASGAAPVPTVDSVPASLGAAGIPQDGDHEFLRMMADHHEGLVVLARDAAVRAADDSVRSAARGIAARHAERQGEMVALIRNSFGEEYMPVIMPRNSDQADSLRNMSGAEADRYFLRTAIGHHEEVVRRIGRFGSDFARPEVRDLAAGLRTELEREAETLRGKLEGM